MIDAKPSDMATVYTAMHNNKEMTKALGQKYSIQTMDMQLYIVAQKVKWHRPQEFENHILRLGGFHEVQCYIAAIGKLWGDAGLRDLLVDSDVYGAATVEQMLQGKQYHRAVRGLTLIFEALTCVQLKAFWKWCESTNQLRKIPDELWQQLLTCHNSANDPLKLQEASSVLYTIVEDTVLPLLDQFIAVESAKSPTFLYWNMLLQAIQVLL